MLLRNILILLILLIPSLITQEIFLTQKYIDKNSSRSSVAVFVIIFEESPQCEMKTMQYSFRLNYCQEYQIGAVLRIIGRVDPQPDKTFFSKKRLIVSDVRLISVSLDSVNSWKRQIWKYSQLVFAMVVARLLQLKQTLLFCLARLLPEPHAGLISGMVFGGDSWLSPEVSNQFKLTGLTHVVSASGYNVSVVISLVGVVIERIFSWLPRWLRVALLLLAIWTYSLMAALVPPVVRAAVMISLSVIASQWLFRQYHPGFGLVVATWLLLLICPAYVRSLSFWLSVTATAGIVLILPLLERSQGWLWRWQTSQLSGIFSGEQDSTRSKNKKGLMEKAITILYQLLAESLLTTIAAQVFTMPLILATFGEASILSFLANALLLWLTPFITLSGLGLMTIIAFFDVIFQLPQWLEMALAMTVWLPTQLFLWGVHELSKLVDVWPWLMVRWQWSWWAVGGWWGSWLVIAAVAGKRHRRSQVERAVAVGYADHVQ